MKETMPLLEYNSVVLLLAFCQRSKHGSSWSSNMHPWTAAHSCSYSATTATS
jgi:hypothetical protein